ncbi:folylpolyglutamate synthase/dihydrofolate synthase family protein [Muribaculum caecicola]|uniref:Bifunctional folylpolyglutamate synthase/dihydrofolate synthase n=1 Tax=Muribaculum caecicola TaxID=3038144 RepID=A0AC61S8A5_9BACT|nr:folylpolyglutamate synthase/dihydrofolate synthase family protein [Muribaculum caecicola]THG54782.1 bifunctional folylpolyglutamate synthase/dihydrofolate synthase [Muribaculum caecicola]
MTYKEATEFLYTQIPMFQRVGASAYKPGLETSVRLEGLFGNPHERFLSIHVAGTNGKGSTAHTLAAVLQCAGYKTGLYTSPHLVDFRERIRVNGEMIGESYVSGFVGRYKELLSSGKIQGQLPSFFELTMVMAFEYFAASNVDVAIVETGLGGRLDSTNIITPELSVITNISYDHMQFLGDTLEKIAAEKAGIIKPGVPVVVGESGTESVRAVFEKKADEEKAPLVFASDRRCYDSYVETDGMIVYNNTPFGRLTGELSGSCQLLNAATIITALEVLRKKGIKFSDADVQCGFANVCSLTGLAGRWMKVSDNPLTICDTGHNIGGWQYIAGQLSRFKGMRRMVVGFVSDKDVSNILRIMPHDRADYYFTQASIPRAMKAGELAAMACEHGLSGKVYSTVADAYDAASADSMPGDVVFVGGSTFVVADFLSDLKNRNLL